MCRPCHPGSCDPAAAPSGRGRGWALWLLLALAAAWLGGATATPQAHGRTVMPATATAMAASCSPYQSPHAASGRYANEDRRHALKVVTSVLDGSLPAPFASDAWPEAPPGTTGSGIATALPYRHPPRYRQPLGQAPPLA